MSAIQLLHQPDQNTIMPCRDNSSFYFVSCGNIITIPYEAIIHASRQVNDIVIYTADNNYKTPHSLKEILDALPHAGFCRIHRSHIISLIHLEKIQNDCVFINGSYLPMTEYYKPELHKKLQLLGERKL